MFLASADTQIRERRKGYAEDMPAEGYVLYMPAAGKDAPQSPPGGVSHVSMSSLVGDICCVGAAISVVGV